MRKDNADLDEIGIGKTPYDCGHETDGTGLDTWMDRQLHGRIEVEICATSHGLRRSEVSENKQRFAADLASAAQQLYELEQEIQGQNGAFGQWLRAAYELNEDFEQPFAEVVDGICGAIREADRQYGREIAQQLYHSQEIIIASEIRRAARYLSYGGQFESLNGLANAGFFEWDPSHEEMLRAVAFMNAGGADQDAFQAAKHGTADTPARDDYSMIFS